MSLIAACRSVKTICRWHIGSVGLQNARAFQDWDKTQSVLTIMRKAAIKKEEHQMILLLNNVVTGQSHFEFWYSNKIEILFHFWFQKACITAFARLIA